MAGLPEELVIAVMQTLIKAAGDKFSAAANMRSACKAWHAASCQYPAALACSRKDDLTKLCKAFPRLASIHLGEPSLENFGRSQLDPTPLSSCTQLTSISMDEVSTYQPVHEVDFSHLPKSLRSLHLANRLPIAGSVSHLTHVTGLTCLPMGWQKDTLSMLLQDLPHLERVVLEGSNGLKFVAAGCSLDRLSGLSSLQLNRGFVACNATEPSTCSLSTIQSLIISETACYHRTKFCNTDWVESFLQKLPQLTYLSFDRNPFRDPQALQQLRVSSLRGLNLVSWSRLQLPPLALQSFAWTCVEGDKISQPELQSIASTTTLISLELRLLQRFTDAKPLQSLPLLQKLRLSECASLGEQLLQRGAFPSLRELHIDDDYPEDEAGYPDLELLYSQGKEEIVSPDIANMVSDFALFEGGHSVEVMDEDGLPLVRNFMKREASQCMSVVMQMPCIEKISGNATLLKLGLPAKLQGWAKSKVDNSIVWAKC